MHRYGAGRVCAHNFMGVAVNFNSRLEGGREREPACVLPSCPRRPIRTLIRGPYTAITAAAPPPSSSP